MQRNNGVTLVVLVITIVVLSIIATLTISAGMSIIRMAEFQTLNTNMLMIQAKIQVISEKVDFGDENETYRGDKDNSILNLLPEGTLPADTTNWYVLKQEHLNEMGLTNITLKNNEYYIVDYENDDVYYIPGFENDGTTHYKLEDIMTLDVS